MLCAIHETIEVLETLLETLPPSKCRAAAAISQYIRDEDAYALDTQDIKYEQCYQCRRQLKEEAN